MPLEAVMMVLDNSEFSRNGDYAPSRLDAQKDAATLLFNAKTQSNPENTVGLLTLADPELLVTLTQDVQKILSALHGIQPRDQVKLITALSIAQLALKHRQNKNQRQRIVLFLHSPIPTADADALLRLGKKLKKNNVSVDVVSWGQQVEENSELLSKFIEAVDGSNENSHLLAAPPGPSLLSDLLISSPIIQEEGGAVPPGITSSAGFEFGVDPNLDPELALALRISMEEEQARQQAVAGTDATAPTPPAVASATDDELAQALAMSMNQDDQEMKDAMDTEDAEADAEIQRAIAMSLGQNSELDPSFLGTLPGVDPNDPRIKDAANKKKEDEGKK
ncbi:MAG: hypothetical protein SGCHY_003696 [Lobulomycetales sp.]